MSKINEILSKVGDLNFKRRVLKMLEYLSIKENDKVLDAGCGEGFYTMVFQELFDCEIFAVDSDISILDRAVKWLKNGGKINVTQGDLCKLEFADNFFDKVVCSEVLEHIPDDTKAVSELFRVMKPGGTLAVTVPNSNYPFLWDPLNKIRGFLGLGHFNAKSEVWGGIWAYDHKRLYSPKELGALLEKAGFVIEETEVLTHYGLPFNHLILVLGKRFYTKLPVSEDVRTSMEKFEWKKNTQSKVSLTSKIISAVFALFKKVDELNDRKFNIDTSTMAISIKAKKPLNN
jgi:ubiquinone/menaquinone biosynthesis C-methylase UbiE